MNDVDDGDDEDAAAGVVVGGQIAFHVNRRGLVEWQPTIPVHPMRKGSHSMHLKRNKAKRTKNDEENWNGTIAMPCHVAVAK